MEWIDVKWMLKIKNLYIKNFYKINYSCYMNILGFVLYKYLDIWKFKTYENLVYKNIKVYSKIGEISRIYKEYTQIVQRTSFRGMYESICCLWLIVSSFIHSSERWLCYAMLNLLQRTAKVPYGAVLRNLRMS
jgi:hypothetical protein